MKIIVAYDISTENSGIKRLNRVCKVCEKYGVRIQNSVFSCTLNNHDFIILKNKINQLIDLELDSILYFTLDGVENQGISIYRDILSENLIY